MLIKDISKINAPVTEGSKPMMGGNEALFAEFSQTLDKIVTKLQHHDKAASIMQHVGEPPVLDKKKIAEGKQNTHFSSNDEGAEATVDQHEEPVVIPEHVIDRTGLSAKNQSDKKPGQAKQNFDTKGPAKEFAQQRIEAPQQETQEVAVDEDSQPQPDISFNDAGEADTAEQQLFSQEAVEVLPAANPQILLSQKTTVTDKQAEEQDLSDLPASLPDGLQTQVAKQDAGTAAFEHDASAVQLEKQTVPDAASLAKPAASVPAAQQVQQATLAAEQNASGDETAQPLEEQVNLAQLQANVGLEGAQKQNNVSIHGDQSKASNLFEKLIIERALLQAAMDTGLSLQGQALAEQSTHNLVQAQLNQQLSRSVASSGATGSSQTAQGLQNLMNQPQKGAESAQRGEMKEAMKTLKPQIESRTMERVESALKEVARAKDGKTISVRLDPPELGTVKIDVSLRDGALHARIVAETPQVTVLLKEKSQELVQIMRKLGLQVEKVSVAVGDHQESFNRNLHEFNSSAQQFGDKRGGQENGSSGNNRGRQSVGVNLAGLQRTTTTNVDDHWVA